MTELMRIKDTVEISLNDDYLSVENPKGLASFDSPANFEEVIPAIYLTELDALVSSIMAEFGRYDTSMDAAMINQLHQSLRLSRRQGADSRMWAWLGVIGYPQFVAWRWKPNSKTDMRSSERFYGNRVRQTFSRLWWAAELTSDGDDYSLTERMVNLPGFQDIYEAVFGRGFGNYRPALQAFVEVVGDKPEKFVREFSKELGYVLTTSVLETMSADDLVEFMSDIVKKMGAKSVAA